MLTTDAALYLPLGNAELEAVLDERQPLATILAPLPIPQIASLVVIRCIGKLDAKQAFAAERTLAETIAHGNARVKRDGADAFVAEALRVLDCQLIRKGTELLPERRIALMDEEALAHRTYLTIDGNWDSAFTERYRSQLLQARQHVELRPGQFRHLTAEQTRIYQLVRSQVDEHIHVQGYAGSGKSYLIRALLRMLAALGAKTIVLSERQAQLDALMQGVDVDEGAVFPMTFDALIDEMLPAEYTDTTYHRMRRRSFSRKQLPDDLVIKHLDIRQSGRFSPGHIVKIVRATVWNFCHQDDRAPTIKHIPRRYKVALDQTTRQMVAHHAAALWQATLSPPSRDFVPPLRAYHRIKWAALNGLRIPDRYTHVLIDESHDRPKPLLQILDSGSQAVISVGDEYQNLQGYPQYRSSIVRQREVTCSVRSGRQLESIVNPLIQSHPGLTKAPFQGNPYSPTEVHTYKKVGIPEEPTVILVTDLWGLFEWSQRLAAESIDFELLSDGENLNAFVNDCVELKLHGMQPRYGELFRYESWDALADHLHERPGFRRIDRMLNQGYTAEHWAKATSRMYTRTNRGYALGLISDVRNLEFGSIMLAPDVMSWAREMKHVARAAISSALYVAVTRAQRRLLIPEGLRDWIDELSSIRIRVKDNGASRWGSTC